MSDVKARFPLIFPGPPTISNSALPCRYRGTMSDNTPSLDDLRRQIDYIDDAIHDLLMRRPDLGRQIGRATGQGGVFIRPGREARVLRRLVARHTGPFPKPGSEEQTSELPSPMRTPYAAFD